MRIWIIATMLVVLAAGCHQREQAQLVAAPLPAASHEWVRLTPEPIEIDGRLVTASCSDFPGTDPAFSFWARGGSTDALVIYFDGGGACWDNLTCSVPVRAGQSEGEGFYKAELLAEDDPTRLDGMFDLANTRNPVRDWSFVFVPYCTGDVHTGANTAQYSDADTGQQFSIQHRGADNFALILAWMRANFAAPQQILVAGSSAGAYGASTHYAEIREAFPQSRAMMLGDSGQGVATAHFIARRNQNWRYALPKAVFGDDASRIEDDDIVTILAAHYPNDRFAQYTTAQDLTQAGFYALMGASNACRAWTQKMTSDLRQREQAPNFRAYLAAGQSHTILRSPLFYTQSTGGAPFVDWFNAMLNGGDGAWSNRVCENCANVTRRCPF
jgi:acetyl esterase/lipase